MTGWDEALVGLAEAVEAAAGGDLEGLLDGFDPAGLLPAGPADPIAGPAIAALLARVTEVEGMLRARRAEVGEELRHLRRLRTAGRGYLSH